MYAGMSEEARWREGLEEGKGDGMSADQRMVKLHKFLNKDAERLIEEMGFDWNEIPGAIANDAVLRLCYEPKKAGLTLQTTLLEIGEIIGLYNDLGELT